MRYRITVMALLVGCGSDELAKSDTPGGGCVEACLLVWEKNHACGAHNEPDADACRSACEGSYPHEEVATCYELHAELVCAYAEDSNCVTGECEPLANCVTCASYPDSPSCG